MHIYAIEAPHGVKVGISQSPTKRIRALENSGGFTSTRAWVSLFSENARAVEQTAHLKMKSSRGVGEWFAVPFDVAMDSVFGAMEAVSQIIEAPEYSPDLSTTGGRLELAIKSSGMTASAIAAKIGVSNGSVSHWCANRHEMNSATTQAVAALIGVSAAWLAFGETSEADAILATLTPPQRAQALRMLEAFAASIRSTN